MAPGERASQRTYRDMARGNEKNLNPHKKNDEIRELKKKNKELERELHRKDKALAEMSALVVLKKKVELLWGDEEA